LSAGDAITEQCTVAYCAPEVLLALETSSALSAAPAQDVFSLGVLACESLTHRRMSVFFDSDSMASDAAAGRLLYPWEESTLDPLFERSKLRHALAACLARDPSDRPAVPLLRTMLDAVGQQTANVLRRGGKAVSSSSIALENAAMS
jgi:serine/threonine protein kinase